MWHSGVARTDPNGTVTAGLVSGFASRVGLMEYHSNHFGGQLRYNLIYLRYGDELNIHRTILTPDGKGILPSLSGRGLQINIGNASLDITQAPNGNIIDIRYNADSITYYKPNDPVTTHLTISTTYPRRGPSVGGNILTIYGLNFNTPGGNPTVTVGDKNCPIKTITATRIECTLPGGFGPVDVTVSKGDASSVFEKGYRYITGVPPPGFQMPRYTG